MPRYRYSAIDLLGRNTEGELSAPDIETAERELQSRGLTQAKLTRHDGDEQSPLPLADVEAEQVVVALAEVSDSQLPLAAGLRAAATECSSRRIAAALRRIAADVESGYSLEHIMTMRSSYLPGYVRGLVVAGARANRLGTVLEELVQHHLILRDTRRQILAALGYPILVLSTTIILLVLAMIWIVPQFKYMFIEWEITLPTLTHSLIALSDMIRWLVLGPGRWILVSMVISIVAGYLFICLRYGPGSLQVLASTLPLLGPMWHWSAAAGFVRLLAILIEQGIPVSGALQLVGDGMPSPVFRKAARQFAEGTAAGRPLYLLASENCRLPASVVPFIQWGERMGELPAALRAVNQMLLTRVRLRAVLLQSIGPPVLFILSALIIGFLTAALFGPMVTLIQGLS